MKQSDFHIGDRCLFILRTETGIPVEVIGYHEEFSNCLWISPDDPNYRMDNVLSKIIGDRYAIATNIAYLKFVERPMENDDTSLDISALI